MRYLINALMFACLFDAAACMLEGAPSNFAFQGIPLEVALNRIAIVGDFNVVVDPRIAKSLVTWSAAQVEPDAAATLLASSRSLRSKWIQSRKSGARTLAVAHPDVLVTSCGSMYTRVVKLLNVRVNLASALLAQQLPPGIHIGVEADSRTNSLVMRGLERDLAVAGRLLSAIDCGRGSIVDRFGLSAPERLPCDEPRFAGL